MSTALALSPASIERADVSSGDKSALLRMYNRVRGSSAISRAKVHALEAGAVIRQGSEAAFTGALLGVAEEKLGSLDYKKVPIDGAVALAGLAGAVAFAHEPFAGDLRNAGSAAAAIFAHRQTVRYLKARKGAAVHGEEYDGDSDMGAEDPIVAALQNL